MEGENHTTSSFLRLIGFNMAYGKNGLFNTLFNTLLTLMAYTAVSYLDIFFMLMHPLP